MCRTGAIGCLVLLLGVAATSAATIEVGNHVLLPNTPNQPIPIWVTGVEWAASLNFNVQMGDGLGPDHGGVAAPSITEVDVLHYPGFNDTGDTIFGAVPNGGEWGSGAMTDQLFERTTWANSGSVQANGLLAVITLNTTGFFGNPPEGHWELKVKETLNAPTELLENSQSADPIPLEVTDGKVSLIPEPATLVLLLSGLLPVLFFARSSRKTRNRSN